MAARIAADPKETPLFRAALGKQKKLSRNPLSANSMRRMLKRRLKDARLPDIFSPHSFRVLVVTDLLTQDVPLEDVQYLAGHANPKTTQIYDRRQKPGHPQHRRAHLRVSLEYTPSPRVLCHHKPRLRLEMRPAGLRRHPEDVLGDVLVSVLRSVFAPLGEHRRAAFLEGV